MQLDKQEGCWGKHLWKIKGWSAGVARKRLQPVTQSDRCERRQKMKDDWVEIAVGCSEKLWENLSQANGNPQQSLTCRGLILLPCSVMSWEQWLPCKCHSKSKDVTARVLGQLNSSRQDLFKGNLSCGFRDHHRRLLWPFSNIENYAQRGREMFQLVNGRGRTWTKVYLFQTRPL